MTKTEKRAFALLGTIVIIMAIVAMIFVYNNNKDTIDEGEYKVVSYTVREGDTLWSIANRNAHEGDKTEDYIAHITAMNDGLKMWTGEVIEILK